MRSIRLEDLEIYKVSMEIADLIYEVVMHWDVFNRDTLGKQILRSADSIALNISEGYGRFYFKENKNFCYYSRGSAKETSTALEKAFRRKLITEAQFQTISDKLNLYFKLSFSYIKSIGTSKDPV